MIIFDNHLHLRKEGRFIEAVWEFKKAGGTHFILCQYPMPEVVIENRSYLPCYQETISIAEEVEKKTGVKVFVTIGPYPVDYLLFHKKMGRLKAVELMEKGMEEASRLCLENERCIGIGEIGRPHFPVNDDILVDINGILQYGMECARDVDVPVVLHTETGTPKLCKELVEMGKRAGLKADKIVKHFSPPLVLFEENYGLMPSILASRKNIISAIEKGTRFLMETDYIDDPKRPGAVLSPKTVPKITLKLLEDGLLTEEKVYQIHKENPEKTYNIELNE